MALHVRSNSNKSPANIFSARHASATGGETRLIRLGRPANDNRDARSRRMAWLALAVIAAAVVLLWLL